MLIDERQMIRFPARRTFKKIWIMIAGFGIFIPIGLALYFGTGERAALLVVAFGGVFSLILIFKAAAPGSSYAVGRAGILLKRGGSTRLVDYEELRGAAVLSEDRAVQALNRYLAPAVQSERSVNLKTWYRSNRAYGNFIRYCSVPVLQETTSVGSHLNIVKFDSRTSGDFVILKLRSGEEFLLSPRDCEGLLRNITASAKLADTTPSSSYKVPDYGLHTEKAARRRRWLLGYALITFAVVAILIILFVGLPNLRGGSEGSGWVKRIIGTWSEGHFTGDDTEAAMETGWVDGDTYRTRITARSEVSATADDEEKSRELNRAVATGWQYSVMSGMIGAHLQDSGLDPDEEQFDALNRAIEDLVVGLEPIVLSREVNQEITEITIVFDLSSPGLRETVNSLLEGALETTEQP
jgi:hypothetical protein